MEGRPQDRLALIPLLTVALLFSACIDPQRPEIPTSPVFSEITIENRRIPLEDSEVALIGRLRGIAPLSNGNLLIVDQMTQRVLEFDSMGTLIRWKGRPGDGPGEFRSPLGVVALDDGRVIVVGPSRVTRLSPDLEFEANLRIEGSALFSGIYTFPEAVVLGTQNHREDGFAFTFLDPTSGDTENPFVRRHPALLSVPYWNALFRTDLAWFEERFVVSHNMVYPVYLFDRTGALVDSLPTPPPSWIEAPRPEPGQFAMAPPEVFEAWQLGFTIMAGVFSVQDRWLVIAHRGFPAGFEDPEYTVDIYDSEFRKHYTDVVLPWRPILGGDCLWVITQEPPSPWTLSCYEPV